PAPLGTKRRPQSVLKGQARGRRLAARSTRMRQAWPSSVRLRRNGVSMTCQPTNIPPKEAIDIEALRARYAQERAKRLTKSGEHQYEHLTSDLAADYEHDPFTPVKPREPISEDLEVAILGGGWTGVLAGYHLQKCGIS